MLFVKWFHYNSWLSFLRLRLKHQYFNRCKDVAGQGRRRQPCKDFPGLSQMPPCSPLPATYYLQLLPATHFHVMAFIATSINMDLLVRTSPSSRTFIHTTASGLSRTYLCSEDRLDNISITLFVKTPICWVLLQGPSHSWVLLKSENNQWNYF